MSMVSYALPHLHTSTHIRLVSECEALSDRVFLQECWACIIRVVVVQQCG